MSDNVENYWAKARRTMVEKHLLGRDVHDELVIRAFRCVPREAFIPAHLQDQAYEDHPLPIGEGQTISQPYMVALMTQLLRLKGYERVLEVGTGSGYQTAILAEICARVYSIERSPELSAEADKRLRQLNYINVHLTIGDGSLGWQEFAPYDRIIVTAGAPSIPNSLKQQLKEGGMLVLPVGDRFLQELKIVIRTESGYRSRSSGGCVFVPLIGAEGWGEE